MAKKKKTNEFNDGFFGPEPVVEINTKSLIFFLLDISGSMLGRWAETLASVELFVNDQKKQSGKADFQLAKFATPGMFTTTVAQPIDTLELVLPSSPNGGATALLDATMESLRIVKEAKDYDVKMLVILTDGEENASMTYGGRSAEVKQALEDAEAEGIAVMFLAIGPQAWAGGSTFGNMTVNVGSSGESLTSSVSYASSRSSLLRSGTITASGYSGSTTDNRVEINNDEDLPF
jgi:uncharacterized protein YegL